MQPSPLEQTANAHMISVNRCVVYCLLLCVCHVERTALPPCSDHRCSQSQEAITAKSSRLAPTPRPFIAAAHHVVMRPIPQVNPISSTVRRNHNMIRRDSNSTALRESPCNIRRCRCSAAGEEVVVGTAWVGLAGSTVRPVGEEGRRTVGEMVSIWTRLCNPTRGC